MYTQHSSKVSTILQENRELKEKLEKLQIEYDHLLQEYRTVEIMYHQYRMSHRDLE